jgi:hypothetical protein
MAKWANIIPQPATDPGLGSLIHQTTRNKHKSRPVIQQVHFESSADRLDLSLCHYLLLELWLLQEENSEQQQTRLTRPSFQAIRYLWLILLDLTAT